MNFNKVLLAERLKEVIKTIQIDKTELARKLKIPESVLVRYTLGVNVPPLDILIAISEMSKINPSVFVTTNITGSHSWTSLWNYAPSLPSEKVRDIVIELLDGQTFIGHYMSDGNSFVRQDFAIYKPKAVKRWMILPLA